MRGEQKRKCANTAICINDGTWMFTNILVLGRSLAPARGATTCLYCCLRFAVKCSGTPCGCQGQSIQDHLRHFFSLCSIGLKKRAGTNTVHLSAEHFFHCLI